MKPSYKRMLCYGGAIVLLLALVILVSYLISVGKYKETVRNITFQNIDIAGVADGSYVGECDVNFVYAKVEVTVQGGKITNIAILEHKNGRGQPAEEIINEMLLQQTIAVDAVSGATNSSLVLRKAVENALLQP